MGNASFVLMGDSRPEIHQPEHERENGQSDERETGSKEVPESMIAYNSIDPGTTHVRRLRTGWICAF